MKNTINIIISILFLLTYNSYAQINKAIGIRVINVGTISNLNGIPDNSKTDLKRINLDLVYQQQTSKSNYFRTGLNYNTYNNHYQNNQQSGSVSTTNSNYSKQNGSNAFYEYGTMISLEKIDFKLGLENRIGVTYLQKQKSISHSFDTISNQKNSYERLVESPITLNYNAKLNLGINLKISKQFIISLETGTGLLFQYSNGYNKIKTTKVINGISSTNQINISSKNFSIGYSVLSYGLSIYYVFDFPK